MGTTRWAAVSGIGMVLAVLAVAWALTIFGQRDAKWPGQAAGSLDDFRRSHPQLVVEPLSETTSATRPRDVLWRLEDRASGAVAVLRRDYVVGAEVRFEPCGAGWPLPPEVRGASCLRTRMASIDKNVRWISFPATGAAGSADFAARLRDFYAPINARDPLTMHEADRLGDRFLVAIFAVKAPR